MGGGVSVSSVFRVKEGHGWLAAPIGVVVGSLLMLGACPVAASPAQGDPGSVALRGTEQASFAQHGDWLKSLGWMAYLIAPFLMFVVAVLPIPAEVPAAFNGVLFGPFVGFLLTWAGAVAGAQVSYELSRRFGRPLVKKLVKPQSLQRLDDIVDRGGTIALLTLRLIPTVAFTAVNWGAGLTSIKRATFFWTTLVGIIPGTILFTATGSGIFQLLEERGALAALLVVLAATALLAVGGRWLLRRVPGGSAK